MTEIPAHELPLMEEFIVPGVQVLEFGDKRNPTGLYRDWYLARGARYVSVDINGRNGAVPLDVRHPFNLGTFDVVTNWGFSEHVSRQAPFWANAHAALNVGGVFVGTTPQPGHWRNHGWSFWHPAPEFFEAWALGNGMEVLRIEDCGPGDPAKRMWGYVLRKVADVAHAWDARLDDLFWRNPNWPFPPGEHVDYGPG